VKHACYGATGALQLAIGWLMSGVDPGAKVLSRLLEDGGYAVHPDELDELVAATEGVLLGPKGTLMDGQSKQLRFVSTTFDR